MDTGWNAVDCQKSLSSFFDGGLRTIAKSIEQMYENVFNLKNKYF